MAGVTALADAATSYGYAVAGSAYVPISVTASGATTTASAPASTVIVTTNNQATITTSVSLCVRINCGIGNDVVFAPSGSDASAGVTHDTSEVV